MNKRIKTKWLKALRSGEYKQGRNELVTRPYTKQGEYEFCCLGVLENLYHLEKGTEFYRDHFWRGTHTDKCAKWSKVSNDMDAEEAKHLTEMNDSGKSFKVIANWIEKHL